MGFESDRPPEKMVGSGPQTRPLVPTGPREGNTIQGKPDVFGTKCPLKVGLRLRALSECPCFLHITQCTYHVQTLPCCQLPTAKHPSGGETVQGRTGQARFTKRMTNIGKGERSATIVFGKCGNPAKGEENPRSLAM